MKLRFHEQTDIRYNHVLHGNRANSKPSSKSREKPESVILQNAEG